MMQSSGLQAGLSGLLAQLIGGIAGDADSPEGVADSGFLETLGGQLKDLLVDRGLDPADIASVDGQELLAQFVALIQGPQPVQPDSGASVGALSFAVDDSSDARLETPTDLLGRLLESVSAGGAVASGLMAPDSEGRSSLAELASFPGLSTSTDRLARLVHSAGDSAVSQVMTAGAGASSALYDSTASAAMDSGIEDGDDSAMTLTSSSARTRTDRFGQVLSLVSDEVALDAKGSNSSPWGSSALATPALSISQGAQAGASIPDLDAASTLAMPDDERLQLNSYVRSGAVGLAGSDSLGQSSQATNDRLARLLDSVSAGGKVSSSGSEVGSDVRSLLTGLANSVTARSEAASADASATTSVVSDPSYEGAAVARSATLALQRLVESFRGGAESARGEALESGESLDQMAADLEGELLLDSSSYASRGAGSVDRLNLSQGQTSASVLDEVVGGLDDVVDAASSATQEDVDASEGDAVSFGASAATSSKSAAGSGLQRAGMLDLYRLLQPGGEASLGDEVKWALSEGLSKAEMRLQPPSLGSLDVRISLDGDKASVLFVSPHPVVREVLEAAMPRLRDALAQDGLSLANLSVADQGARGGDPSSARDGSSANDSAASGTSQQTDALDAEEMSEHQLLNTTVSALSKRLDYYI